MAKYKTCPKCGGIAEYNAYYGRTTCTRCAWEIEKQPAMAKYIDCEQLLDAFGEEPLVWLDEDAEVQRQNDWRDFRALIERQPAADVALVRHGWWKRVGQVCIDGEYEDTIRCSKCNAPHDRKSKYCPNCGATMDGED